VNGVRLSGVRLSGVNGAGSVTRGHGGSEDGMARQACRADSQLAAV